MIREFALFVREKGVIGLAVGIIVGGAITKLVTAIVTDLVNPVIGAIVGRTQNLADYALKIPFTSINLLYGDLILQLINF
jgi:large conductance mechanosensitive channel